MSKMVVLALAIFLISIVGAGMFAYTQTANLDSWGDYRGLMEMAPVLFVTCGAGGVIVYAFVGKG